VGRLIIVFFLFGFFVYEGQAQKHMSISDDLYENSDRFDVGRRIGWVMSRYHYNSFEVFQAKQGTGMGIQGGSTESNWFGRSKKKANSRFSFGFASHRGDTALVHLNMTYEDRLRSSFFGRLKEVQVRSYNLSGLIETNDQNSIWNLTISQEYGTNMGENSYFGWLTNGDRRIEIVPVFNYQNPGRKSLTDIMVGSEIWFKGFEFVENNRAIGAVQAAPMNSMSVWFSKQNDPMTDFVIGSTFAALLHEYDLTDNRTGLWF